MKFSNTTSSVLAAVFAAIAAFVGSLVMIPEDATLDLLELIFSGAGATAIITGILSYVLTWVLPKLPGDK